MANFFAELRESRKMQDNPLIKKTTDEKKEGTTATPKRINPLMALMKKKMAAQAAAPKAEEPEAPKAETEGKVSPIQVESDKPEAENPDDNIVEVEEEDTELDDIKAKMTEETKETAEPEDSSDEEKVDDKAEDAAADSDTDSKPETDTEDASESEPDDTPDEEEKPEPKKAEEKPKKRRHRRSHAEVEAEKKAKAEAKAKKEAEKVAKEAEAEDDSSDKDAGILVSDYRPIDVFGESMSANEAAGLLRDHYEDQSFRDFQKEVIEKVNAIKIDPDMNVGALKYAAADVDALYSQVMIHLIEARKAINSWTNKEYGPITAYRVEHSVGKNDAERRRNGFSALANGEIDGHKVNFLSLVTREQIHLEFFQGIKEILDTKRQLLVTMNGALKMENTGVSLGN